MDGFFSKTEVGQGTSDCNKCKLYKGCKTPKMKESGKGRKKILIIGEAPGETEDLKGKQFVGQAGQVLRSVLEGLGISLDTDCWKINAVNCRPPENKTPTKREVSLCRPRVLRVIEEKKPHLIILLGGTALNSLISYRYKDKKVGGITKWRGYVIPDRDIKCWVAPAFHPSYVLRSQAIPAVKKLFRDDLTRFMSYLNEPFPKKEKYKIHIIPDKSLKWEKEVPKLLAFDYETTGLKPYAKGHEIVCCGISYKKNEAYVFEMNKKMKKLWKPILKNKHIKKTAQNMKFEHSWSKEILKTTVRGWKWDTMLATHILDNRSGITGLKFQVYINFGIIDYDSHIKKYLESENGNSFNRVKEAPRDELLKYCGMDALMQYKLAMRQTENMNEPTISFTA